MKTNVINRILEKPLTFPYFDSNKLREIQPMDLRYKLAMYEVTDSVINEHGVDEERIPEILLAQYQAGRYIAQKLKNQGITNVVAAEKSGMDVTTLSKALSGRRPFSPNAGHLIPLCCNVLHESCHKIMFGEEGRIKLPSPYAQVAKAMMDLEDSEKKKLLSKAKIQYALFAKMHPCGIPNGYRREQSRVISERIHELLYDKGRQGYQFFGPDTPYQIRAVLKQYLLETSMKATPRIGFLMYLSFETELALDYFISEDFTKYTSCYYYADDGTTEIEIDDSEVRSYIGICASLPPEQRQLLMGEAIGINLGKSF